MDKKLPWLISGLDWKGAPLKLVQAKEDDTGNVVAFKKGLRNTRGEWECLGGQRNRDSSRVEDTRHGVLRVHGENKGWTQRGKKTIRGPGGNDEVLNQQI